MTATHALYPDRIQGDGLELRPWDHELLRQVASWGERGFPYRSFDTGHLRDPDRAATMLEFARQEGRHRHFIACEGETAVGRVSVNLEDSAGIYIWAVHVPPEHAGRGVARRMIAALLSWLEETQPPRDFVLTVNGFATDAQAVYRSQGFEIHDTRWQYDADLSADLMRADVERRRQLAGHIRLVEGRWEVRVHVMRRANRRLLG